MALFSQYAAISSGVLVFSDDFMVISRGMGWRGGEKHRRVGAEGGGSAPNPPVGARVWWMSSRRGGFRLFYLGKSRRIPCSPHHTSRIELYRRRRLFRCKKIPWMGRKDFLNDHGPKSRVGKTVRK